MGYIINEEDLLIEENISRVLLNISVDTSKPNISEINQDGNIIVDFPKKSKNNISFKSSGFYTISNITASNVGDYIIEVNGSAVSSTAFELNKYDKINIKINRVNIVEKSIITLVK